MSQVNVLADKVNALEMALPMLPEKDRNFASDLICGKWGFKTKGTLSQKQVYWVDTLLARALDDKPQAQASLSVGSFAAVYALFEKAKAVLKFPKIRLAVDGFPVVLSLAGAKSKTPGVVNVTDGEKFGFNKYYGKVDKEGEFKPGFKQFDESGKVVGILSALAANPIKVAKEYGSLTGYCCFCNKALTDEQSVAAGFGPVCAKNFGLWGAYKNAEGVLQ